MRERKPRVIRSLSRYALLGTFLASVASLIALGIDLYFKHNSQTFDQIKLETDLLDKIQGINKELQDNTIAYNTIRNEYYSASNDLDPRAKNRLKMEYNVAKGKMLQLCEEYNILQTHIATIENTKPHFYVFGLDLWIPAKIIQKLIPRVHQANESSDLPEYGLEVITPLPKRDPLIEEASRSLSNLFSLNGYSYPSDRGWIDANYENYFVTNVEWSVITSSDSITNGNIRMWVIPVSNANNGVAMRIAYQDLRWLKGSNIPMSKETNMGSGQH
jgi:hypothetical protein